MRKEYNDRWNAPLVNPGITMEEYERELIKRRSGRTEENCTHDSLRLTGKFETEKLDCDNCGFRIPF